jgi:hypothetical protein
MSERRHQLLNCPCLSSLFSVFEYCCWMKMVVPFVVDAMHEYSSFPFAQRWITTRYGLSQYVFNSFSTHNSMENRMRDTSIGNEFISLRGCTWLYILITDHMTIEKLDIEQISGHLRSRKLSEERFEMFVWWISWNVLLSMHSSWMFSIESFHSVQERRRLLQAWTSWCTYHSLFDFGEYCWSVIMQYHEWPLWNNRFFLFEQWKNSFQEKSSPSPSNVLLTI